MDGSKRSTLKDFFVAAVPALVVGLVIVLVTAPSFHESAVHLNTSEYIILLSGGLIFMSLVLPPLNYLLYLASSANRVVYSLLSLGLAVAVAVAVQPSIVKYMFRPSDNTWAYWFLLIDISLVVCLSLFANMRSRDAP